MKESFLLSLSLIICFNAALAQNSILSVSYTFLQIPSIAYNQQLANLSEAYYEIQTASSGYTVIRVDAEDQYSDPDVYISINYPVTLLDNTNSDQHCERMGSDVCILDPNVFQPKQLVYFVIKCVQQCTFTLVLDVISVSQYKSQSITALNPRSTNIFNYTIPANASGLPTNQVAIQVQAQQLNAPFELYLAKSLQLSIADDREYSTLIDGGKSIVFASTDLGFCVNCSIYIIITTRIYTLLQISVVPSSTSAQIQDQVNTNIQLESLQGQCFPYNVLLGVNDVTFYVEEVESDVDVSAVTRNTSTGQVANTVLISEEPFSRRQIIVRSQDRVLQQIPDGVFYLCLNSIADASLVLTSQQFVGTGRFQALDGVLNTFNLDSLDVVYFYFTSQYFTSPQQIQVQAQIYNPSISVPYIYWTICSSPIPDNCVLTQYQQLGQPSQGMNQLPPPPSGSLIMTSIINHNPSGCNNPTSCYYLISVFNNQLSGPTRVSFKTKVLAQSIIPVLLFNSYSNILASDTQDFFQLQFTSLQLLQLNITSITAQITLTLGSADLYSSLTGAPSPQSYDQLSRTLSLWSSITYNTTLINLSQQSFYFGVYARTKVQYQIQFTAEYQANGVSTIPQTCFNPSTPSTPQIVVPTNISSGNPFVVNFTANISAITLAYYPDFSVLESPQSIIVVLQTQDPIDFNVSYAGQTWTPNANSTVIISQDSFEQDPTQIFLIQVFAQVPGTFCLGNLTLFQQQYYSQGQIEMRTGYQYNTYNGDISNYQVYRQTLLGSNFTYQFNLNTIFGTPTLLYLTSSQPPLVSVENNQTYQLRDSSNSTNLNLQINSTVEVRGNYSASCKNSSYSIRGGNPNCSMYLVVYCPGLCIYNFSSTMLGADVYKLCVPNLFIPDQLNYYDSNLIETHFYYIPYNKATVQNIVVAMNKISNDSLMVGRLINNAYLPYYNWSYPTNFSYDFIMRSGPSVKTEALEVNTTFLTSKCTSVNMSCILLVGVYANSPLNTVPAIATLKYLSPLSRLGLRSFNSDSIQNPGEYGYYWFLLYPTLYLNQVQTVALQLRQNQDQAILLFSVITGIQPNALRYDYISNNTGSQQLVVRNQDPVVNAFINAVPTRGRPVIVIVGVKSITSSLKYSILNYGPYALNNQNLQAIDLRAILQSQSVYNSIYNINQNQAANTLTPNSVVFKQFAEGEQVINYNITCKGGSIQVLASVVPYNLEPYQNAMAMLPLLLGQSSLTNFNPVNLIKGQSVEISFSQYSFPTYWCQFCWVYLQIIQTNYTGASNFTFSAQLQDDGVMIMTPNQVYNHVIPTASSPMQMKYLPLSSETVTFIVTSPDPFTNISVFISPTLNYNLKQYFVSSGLHRIVYALTQQNSNLQVGTYIYFSVNVNQSNANITMLVSQKKTIQLLQDGNLILDQMYTPFDNIKYYQLQVPNSGSNLQTILSLNLTNPGFIASFYLLRNDFYNGTFSYTGLSYPTITNSTISSENTFLTPAQNQQLIFQFVQQAPQYVIQTIKYQVQQNITVNKTVQQNITVNVTNTTTHKNQTVVKTVNVTMLVPVTVNVTQNYTVTSLWQSYYTLAVYLSNQATSGFEKAQFSLLYQTNASSQIASSSTDTPQSTKKKYRHLEESEEDSQENIGNALKRNLESKHRFFGKHSFWGYW